MTQEEVAGFGALSFPLITHILCTDLEEAFECLLPGQVLGVKPKSRQHRRNSRRRRQRREGSWATQRLEEGLDMWAEQTEELGRSLEAVGTLGCPGAGG